MKQKIFILGLAAALLISLGTVFKLNHWPAAGHMLVLGIFILVCVFLPLALRNNYKAEGNDQNKILYWVTGITCFVVFIGMLFKFMHWPYAGMALLISLPFPYIVFLPVFIIVTGKNKNFNIYNTVFILFLLTAVSAVSLLLALNVSKERIADSLALAGNYNRVENTLSGLPYGNRQSTVNQKIDEVVKISQEYREAILACEGVTPEQWKEDPESWLKSDKWPVSNNTLMEKGEQYFIKLRDGLSNLILLLEKSPGCESLAKAAPAIFDMGPMHGFYNFNSDLLFAAQQPWLVTYLDGLETNLKLIRTTLPGSN